MLSRNPEVQVSIFSPKQSNFSFLGGLYFAGRRISIIIFDHLLLI